MLKIHNLTPDSFHNKYLLTDQRSTMISDYCLISGINFEFDEDSYLCEVELPKNALHVTEGSDILEAIDWEFFYKNSSKKLIITHRIIYNLEDYLDKLNELVLKYDLNERVYWFTINPLDFRLKHKCHFKFLFLDSLTNVLFEGRINNTYYVRARDFRDPAQFHKYQYSFEPQNNTFEMLSFDNCSKHFMASSAAAKAHRLLSTYLIKERVGLEKGIVTYHGFNDKNLSLEHYLSFFEDPLSKYDISIQDLLNFRSFRGDNFDDISSHPFERSLAPSFLNAYEKCLINYVNESTANELEIFITEKIWLNYAHGKPFILNGNKGSLYYLNKYYGFKSFESIFDESYDLMDNFVDRVYYGVEELRKFCSLSLEEAKDKVKEVQKVLDHNFKVFYSINHKDRFLKIFDEI